ncbi:hypothetical protein EAE99_001736 [Botrytis elliptica]|nr:hypothetical protein EAE99_001736 [Botrytis elliptica]
MGFFQRAEEKLFGWYKVINEGRPYCLQDVHLVRTASQASITLSGYKDRRRLAREVERQEQQESGTHFKETCNLFEHIFDMWIGLCKCQGNGMRWNGMRKNRARGSRIVASKMLSMSSILKTHSSI